MEVPTLQNLLGRLRRLQVRGGTPATTTNDWYEVHLFPPARESEIHSALRLVNKPLPEDFKQFWRYTDGANLFVNESGLHGVGVASTELLIDLHQEEIEVYGDTTLEDYVVFARVNGSGDFLVFHTPTGRVLDGIHAEQPEEWRVVANSFNEWLHAFIEAGGRYYWIEELYASSPST